jgi:hypothetical protein
MSTRFVFKIGEANKYKRINSFTTLAIMEISNVTELVRVIEGGNEMETLGYLGWNQVNPRNRDLLRALALINKLAETVNTTPRDVIMQMKTFYITRVVPNSWNKDLMWNEPIKTKSRVSKLLEPHTWTVSERKERVTTRKEQINTDDYKITDEISEIGS